MKVVVDLNRCESYGQCVYAAPSVFWLHGEESLQYVCEPDDVLRAQVERAAAACPVQAISIDRSAEGSEKGTARPEVPRMEGAR